MISYYNISSNVNQPQFLLRKYKIEIYSWPKKCQNGGKYAMDFSFEMLGVGPQKRRRFSSHLSLCSEGTFSPATY